MPTPTPPTDATPPTTGSSAVQADSRSRMPSRLPARVLADLLADDPGRPRLTWYDDGPGSTHGERIELSAKVVANWVAKAGNLLQDDLAAGPGTTVGLDLPAHWRAAYWAMATWEIGATVVVGSQARGADVLVTTDVDAAAAHDGDAVLVTTAALARSHPDAARAPGAVDEARELSTHGDRLVPSVDPEPADLALSVDGADTSYADVVRAEPAWGDTPRVALRADLATALTGILSAWAAGGSVVLVHGADDAVDLPARLASEAVTVDLTGSGAESGY